MENRKQIVETIIDALSCRSGFDDWWNNLHEDVQTDLTDILVNILDEQLQSNTNDVSVSLIPEAMEVIDEYLNSGCKDSRRDASKKAKKLYEKYTGEKYKNRNER